MEKIIIDYKLKGGHITCSPNILKLVREKFSIQNPVYMQRRFQPRKYVITPSGAFQVGLWEEMNKYLSTLNIPIEITLTKAFKAIYEPKITATLQPIDGFTYYDYQEIMINEFIKHGRGIGILATSAGKGLVIAGLIKSLLHTTPSAKVLIIVPNTLLLNQLYNSFIEEFNLHIISRWGDKNLPDLTKNVFIANSQILLSDIKDTLTKFQKVDYVIIDEVHKLGEKSNKINKVIHNITTPYKFGVTGTLPDNLMAAWNIVGKVGPILYEKNSYEIRQQGTAAQIETRVINCHHTKSPAPVDPNDNRPTARYEKELEFIIHNPERNNLIKQLVSKVNNNSLILVDRLIHGQILLDLMKDINKKVYFVQGSTESDARTEITQLMETQNDIVCIAISQIFSTGLSIKNLHYLVFVALGKSNVKVLQSIGRSMRMHKDKDKSVIFDLADNLHYSADHARQRIKMYKEEKIPYSIKIIKL